MVELIVKSDDYKKIAESCISYGLSYTDSEATHYLTSRLFNIIKSKESNFNKIILHEHLLDNKDYKFFLKDFELETIKTPAYWYMHGLFTQAKMFGNKFYYIIGYPSTKNGHFLITF